MKPPKYHRYAFRICALPFAALFAVSASAANISWTGTADAVWSTGGNLEGGVAPVATDVAVFDAGSLSNLTASLGPDFSIQGLRITTHGGLITIGGANALTPGTGGIGLSGSLLDLQLNALVALAAEQSRNVITEKTLAASAVISGAEVNLSKIGIADLTFSGPNMFAAAPALANEQLNETGILNGTKVEKLAFTDFGTLSIGVASQVNRAIGELRMSDGGGVSRSANHEGKRTVKISSRGVGKAGAKEKTVVADITEEDLRAALKLKDGTGPLFVAAGADGLTLRDAGFGNTSADNVTGFVAMSDQNLGRQYVTSRLVPLVSPPSSGAWTGATNALWAIGTNWGGGTAPGTGDTAVFNGASSNLTPDLGAGVTVNTISFETSSAAAYTIGTGSSQSLTLNNGGGITMGAGVNNAEAINASIVLGTDGTTQTFAITSYNTFATSKTLTFGVVGGGQNISGSSGSGVKTLNVIASGVQGNVGNTISIISNITDGAGGGTVKLVKDGDGNLQIGGGSTTNTYSGGTYLNAGTLTIVGAGTSLKAGSSLFIAGGTTLNSVNAPGTFSGIVQQWNGDFTFGDSTRVNSGLNSMTFNTGTVDLGATGTDTVRTVNTLAQTLTVNSIISNGTNGTTTGLTKTGAGTLVLGGINTYTGTTTVNAGTLTITATPTGGGAYAALGSGTLNISGLTGSLVNSTAVTIAGGNLTLTNTTTAEGSVNRISNSAAITSNGGTLTYTNTTGNTYAENVGNVTLNGGQLNTVLSTNMATGIQTLTFNSLTQNNRSTATFSAATTTPNATANIIKVNGATATAGGQIIGPWATTGTSAIVQTDYAVYDAASNIIAANIAGSLDSTWTDSTKAYTSNFLGGGAGNALSAVTHNMAALRNLPAFANANTATTIAIPTGGNLNTFGLLNANQGLWTINQVTGSTGALSTLSGGGSIYINTGNGTGAGNGFITIGAPINDNGGAVSIVKTGTGNTVAVGQGVLTLSNVTSNYSGATVINGGAIVLNTSGALADINVASSLGKGSSGGSAADLVLNGGFLQYGTATTAVSTNRLFSIGAMGGTIDSSAGTTATMSFIGTGAMGFASQTGPRTLTLQGSNVGVAASTSGSDSSLSTIALLIGDNSGATSLTKTGTGTWVLSNPVSTYTGPTTITGGILNVGTFAAANTASSLGKGSATTVATDLVLNGGTLQYSNNTAATTNRLFSVGTSNGTIDSSAASPSNTLSFTATGAMGFNNTVGARTLTLTGTNFGANSMGLRLDDFGGLTNLTKSSTGTWVLANAGNTYTGVTTINSGILSVGKLANGGIASSIGASTNAATNLMFSVDNSVQTTVLGTLLGSLSTVPTLKYTGTGDSTDRLFRLQANTTVSRALAIDASGSGALSFTNAGSPTFNSANIRSTFIFTGSSTDNNTFGGIIPNNGTQGNSVVKTGPGTWILSGNNTYSDNAGTASDFGTMVNQGTLVLSGSPTGLVKTTVNAGGTLRLDYSTNNTSKLADTVAILQLAGGTLELSGGSHTEVVTSTTLAAGASSVTQTNGGTATLNMGAITRQAGSTLDVPTGIVLTSNGSGANSLLTVSAGAYATVGAEWAAMNAGNTAIVAYNTVNTYNLTTASALGGVGNQSDVDTGIDTTLASGASTSTLRFNQNEARTITIGGGQTLTLTNGGILVTANVNPGSGTSTITGGTLKPGSNNALQIIQNSSKGMTIDSIVTDGSAASALTKSGSGTLTLTGVNTYTGATFVNAGTLTISGSGGLSSSSAITIASGATLNYTSSANQTLGATSGFGNFIWNPSNSTAVLTAGARGATPAVFTIKSGFISGIVGNLGTGPASDLILDGGTIRTADGGGGTDATSRLFTLGTGGGTIQIDTLAVPGNSTRPTEFQGIGAIAFTGTGARTLNFLSSTSSVSKFSPALGDGPGGATSVTMGGGGTSGGTTAYGVWALDGANTYTGTTTVNTGSLSIRKTQTVNNGVAYFTPSNVIVASGAGIAIGVGAAPTYFDSTAIATILDVSHLGASTATAGLKPGALFGLDTTAGDFIYNGVLSDLTAGTNNVFNFAKHGINTLTLSGNNTYTGTTTIYGNGTGGASQGTSILRAGSATAFGPATTANIVFDQGSYQTINKLQLFGNNTTVVGLNSPVSVHRDGSGQNFIESGSSDTSGTGTDILTINTPVSTTSTWNNAQALNGGISRIQDGAARRLGITKGGAGTLELGGTNTYTGGTIINAGILRALSTTGFGAANSAALAFGSGSTGTVQLNGNSMTIVGLNTDPTIVGTPFVEAGATSATLTINPPTTSPSTFAGVLRNNSGSGGVLTLAVGGPGTLTLSGNNTYTGTTTVSGGTLILSGNNSGATGNMSISAGAIAQFNALNSILSSGRNVADSGTVVFGPSFGAGNIASALLTKITPGSTGAIAADNYAGTNFDFNTAGLTAASLGAVGNVTYSGTFTPNGTTYRLGGGGGILTYSAAISGAGNALTIAGPGTVILSNSGNNYGGATSITGGTMTFSGSGNMPTGTALTVSGSGILDLAAASRSVGGVTISGGTIQNGTLTGTSYTGTGGTVTASLGGAVTFTNSGGTTTLNANNSGYSGAINITGGTLRAVDAHSLGTGLITLSGAGGLTLLNDGTGAGLGNGMVQSINYGNSLTTSGTTITIGQFTSAGTLNAANKILQLNNLSGMGQGSELDVVNNNNFGLEITGTTTITGQVDFAVVSGLPSPAALPGLIFSGKITGAGTFFIANNQGRNPAQNGTIRLTNPTNDFTGNLSVNSGIITITSDGAAGAAANRLGIAPAGGTNGGIQFDGTFSTARALDLSSAFYFVTQGNTLTYTGSSTAWTNPGSGFNKADNGIFKIASDISNAAGANMTGPITIAGGAILVSNLGALGTTGSNTTVNNNVGAAVQLDALTLDGGTIAEPFNISNSGINTGGALQAIGGTQANPRSISTSGVVTLANAATIGADAFTTLNIGTNSMVGTQALTLAGAGNINISTALPALGSLTKIGSGTTNLSAASTSFVQALTVNAGTLTLSGAAKLGNASSVTVNPGGTLTLDNSGTSTDSRIGGTTRTLTLAGGTLNFIGNNTTESLGNLQTTGSTATSAGFNQINMSGTGTNTLTFASFSSNAVNGHIWQFNIGSGNTLKFTAAIPADQNGIFFGNTGSSGTRADRFFVGNGTSTLDFAFQDASNNIVPWDYTSGGAFNTANADLGNLANTNPGGIGTINIKPSGTQSTITATNANIATVKLTGGVGINMAAGAQLTINRALIDLGGGDITGGSITSGGTIEFVLNYATDGTISSALLDGGISGLNKAGLGNLTLSGKSSVNSTTYVSQGTLTLGGGNNTLATNKGMMVNNGATLALGSNNQYLGSLTSTGSVEGSGGTITGSGTLITNGTNGTFAGNIGGSINFVKAGANTMTLVSPQSTTGTIFVIGGGLTLKDGATLLGTTGGIAIKNATLTLDNTGTKDLADRVNSSVITLDGGAITFNGRAQFNSAESLGAVAAGSGMNSITAIVGNGPANISTYSAQLTLASLTRASGATLRLDGSNFGIGNSARILVAGDSASLTGNLAPVFGIVPGVFKSGNGSMVGAVGYVDGLGFGTLDTAGFPRSYSGNTLSAATVSDNVTGATAWVVKSGGQTVNSLARGGNITFLSDSDVLTIGSGMTWQGSESANKLGVEGGIRGKITSGTGELFWIKTNEGSGGGAASNINSVITDNGGTRVKFVIAAFNRDDLQNQRPYMTANNTYTGGTVLSGGNTLILGASIPGWTTIPAANDPTQGLFINNSQVTMQTNAGQIAASNIVTLNGGSTLTYAGNNTQAGLVLNSNGGTATPTINGFNILTLTGNITSTPTNVAVVPIISGTTLDLNDSSHNITVDGGTTTGSLFHVGNGATLTGLTISSIINSLNPASGSITKLGTGVLELSGANVFTGGLNINAGAVKVSNAGAIGGGGNVVTLNGGALWLNAAVSGQTIIVGATGGSLAALGDQSLADNITLNGALAISLADPTLNNTDRQITYSAVITGTGSVTVTGNVNNPFNATPKPLLLTNATSGSNNFTGGLTIGLGGRVKPSAAYNIGSITGSLTVNSGGVLDLNNTAQTVGNFTGTGGQVINGSVFTIGNGSSATTGNYAGVISGGSLIKTGTGTITFSGTNTYTGGTTVSQGTLALDFTTATTAAPVLAATGVLTLGSGTLNLLNGSGAKVQVVASTTLTGGLSNVTQSGGTTTLRMNTITPGVGVVNFGAPSIADTDNTNDSSGILGAWAIIGGTDWAKNSTNAADGLITAYTGYTDIDVRTSTIANGSTTNVRLVGDGSAGNIALGAATTTVNTVLQNNASFAGTVDTAGKALVTNGIMIGSGKEALTIGAAVGDGSLNIATAGANLALINNNAAKTLIVNAPILVNGASGLSTTGNVLIKGLNTYTGNTGVGNGTLEIGGAATLQGGNYAGAIQIGSGGTLKYNSSAAQTFSGAMSGVGGLLVNAGTLTLSNAANGYFGGTVVNGATLINGAANAISGALTVNSGGVVSTAAQYSSSNSSMLPQTITINGGEFRNTVSGIGNTDFYVKSIDMTGGSLTATGATQNFDSFFNTYSNTLPITTHASSSVATISAPIAARNITLIQFTTEQGTTGGADLVVSGPLFWENRNGNNWGITKTGAGTMAITSNNDTTSVPHGYVFNTGGGSQQGDGYYLTTTISAGTLQLGNNTASGSLNPLSPIVDNATLAFYRTDTITQGTHFNSVISGTGGVSQVGSGTTVLNGANTYTGLTLVSAGTLSYGASNVIATGAVTVNGVTAVLAMGANQTDSVGTVTLDGGGSITGTGTSALTSTGSFEMKSGSVSAILAGSGIALNKTTAGTVTLSGANTYSGVTTLSAGTLVISGSPTAGGAVTINGGTLRLDYGTNNTTKIADGTLLTMAGGSLELAGGSHTEIVGSTAIAAGASTVTRSSGASVLRMNALTRNVGATLNFSANDIASTSTANDASGILGVWATVGGTDWAMNSGVSEGGGNNYIKAYTGYADIDAQAGGVNPNIVDGAGNVRILNDGVAGAIGLSATTTSVNSLQKNNATFATTVATSGKTLRVNAIMLNPAAKSLTIGAAANDGTLTSATSSGSPDVTLINNSASELLTVNAVIANNTVASTLNKLGAGTVVLGGANTFSGATTISVGVINMANNLALQNSTVDVGVNNNALTFAAGITAPTVGGLQGSGNLTLTTTASEVATLGVGNNGATTTYSGALSGGGALTKTGTGTLVLTGANSYGGITTVSTGTLQIGNGGTAGSLGGGNVTDNGSLVFNRSDALTVSNAISGSGSLTQSGTGTLTLSGANAFVGAAILSAGTLSVGVDNNLGIANPVTFDGGTLQVTETTLTSFGLHVPAFNNGKLVGFDIANAANTFTVSQTMNQGGGGLTKLGAGTLVLTGANTYGGTTTVSTGTLQIGNGGAAGNLGGGNVTDNGSLIFNRSDALTVSNVISGSGSLTQSGAGTLTLNGTNTYSGSTTLSTGTLSLGSGTAIGTGALIISGGALDSAAASLTNANNNPQNWNGDFTFVGTNSLNLGTGAVTMSATRTVTVNANTLSIGGSISGAGLTKAGAGTLLLSGANTFVGATTLSAGTLSVSADSNLGSANALIFDGGTLQITGSALNNFGAHTPTFNAGKTVAVDIASAANTFTITQILNQGAGGLTKTGPGTLVLTGANTYGGITTVSAGTLQIGNGGTSGNLGGGNVVDNGSLIFNRSDSLTASGAISGNGSLTQTGTGVLTLSTANSYTGATTMNAGTLSAGTDANLGNANPLVFNGGTLQITGTALNSYAAGAIGSHPVTLTAGRTVSFDINNPANNFTVAQILNQGSAGLTKLGAGILTLSNANTFTGAVTLNAGTLSVGADTNLGNGNALVFNGGTLQITGTALNSYAGGVIGTHAVTLTPGATVGFDIASAANTLTVGQILNQGAGGLTKAGAGTLVLGGANTYTGDTNVNGGALAVTGGSISGTTMVNSSGTLAGDNGTLANVTINSGGALSPGGGGIGALTVNGDINLNGSSIFSVQFDSTAIAVDTITLNGNLNIASGAMLNVSDIGSNPSSIFGVTAPVITYSGTWNGGTFAGLTDDSYFMSAGQAYQISYDGGAVTLTMLAVIPEPGAAVSLLGGLGLLLGVRRRRS